MTLAPHITSRISNMASSRPNCRVVALVMLFVSLGYIGLQIQEEDSTISSTQLRRQLSSPRPQNETQVEQYMISYLGGLYPPIDKNMLPLYLRNTYEKEDTDRIFFWHIPKASGSTMKNILNFCFDLSRAEQLQAEPSMQFAKKNILNMDTTSPKGLAVSYANNLVNANKVDLIVSNYFLSGSALFTDQHHGRTFTILRHPVELAISLFYYRRQATWERSYQPAWTKLTFHDFVSSDHYMDNWMVRQLTGTSPWVDLKASHLERAKRMLKEKIFVGIMSEMDETLRQLKAHFGWKEKEPYCAYNYLHSAPTNQNKHPAVPKGGSTWRIVVEKEKYDMGLYYYALELFAEQANKKYPAPKGEGGGSSISWTDKQR